RARPEHHHHYEQRFPGHRILLFGAGARQDSTVLERSRHEHAAGFPVPFSRVEYVSDIQVALTPDSMEMLCADFESPSLSIRDLRSSCRCPRLDGGWPGEQRSAL